MLKIEIGQPMADDIGDDSWKQHASRTGAIILKGLPTTTWISPGNGVIFHLDNRGLLTVRTEEGKELFQSRIFLAV